MTDTTATNAELLPNESLDNSMQRGLNLAALALIPLADSKAVPPGEGNNVEVTWSDDFAIPTGTKVETAEAQLVSTTTDSAIVTAGTLAFTFRVSRELRTRAKMVDKAMQNVRNGTRKAMVEVESDGFSLTSTFANSTSEAGNDLTDDRFRTTQFLFLANEPDLGGALPVFFCGYIQLENWFNDLEDNGGTWLSAEKASGDMENLVSGNRSTFRGARYGVEIHATQNTQTTGTDRNCVFVAQGETSPFIYRSWNPIEVEEEYFSRRRAWEHTISIEYGWAAGRDQEAFELILDDT